MSRYDSPASPQASAVISTVVTPDIKVSTT